jgi:hypothetical protein
MASGVTNAKGRTEAVAADTDSDCSTTKTDPHYPPSGCLLTGTKLVVSLCEREPPDN